MSLSRRQKIARLFMVSYGGAAVLTALWAYGQSRSFPNLASVFVPAAIVCLGCGVLGLWLYWATRSQPRLIREEKNTYAIATTQRRVRDWFMKRLNESALQSGRDWLVKDTRYDTYDLWVVEASTTTSRSDILLLRVTVDVSQKKVILMMNGAKGVHEAPINDQEKVRVLVGMACTYILNSK